MKRELGDDDIRRSFAELRAADERAAPRFDATLAAARAAAPRRAAPWRRLVAAAAVLLIAAGGAWFAMRQHRGSLESAAVPAAASLSRWRSPTAFLLDGPGDMLIKTVPSITTSTEELKALGVKDARGDRS